MVKSWQIFSLRTAYSSRKNHLYRRNDESDNWDTPYCKNQGGIHENLSTLPDQLIKTREFITTYNIDDYKLVSSRLKYRMGNRVSNRGTRRLWWIHPAERCGRSGLVLNTKVVWSRDLVGSKSAPI
jgi:hypothetical protein